MMPIVAFTWEEIDVLVTQLEIEIKTAKKKYDLIAGIARGGLIPAVMLSHRLGVQFVSALPDTIFSTDKKTLVVDEIYDTGNTIKFLISRNTAIDTAVLVTKDRHAPVTFYGSDVIGADEWVEFPWETKND